MPKVYSRALTIAGSDSGGGAGIQADLKTFTVLGVYGSSVITALTAQNTCEVRSILSVPSKFIVNQIDVVLQDIGADAIKIGMLHRKNVIEAVARRLRSHQKIPIVLDPVMIAKSGDVLLKKDAIQCLKNKLLPLAKIMTPNLPETEILLGRSIRSQNEVEEAARDLLKLGPEVVVLKGGHALGTWSADCVATRNQKCFLWLRTKRIQTKNTHGTGCTFSAAIAAYLAKGLEPIDAIKKAKTLISNAIQSGAPYKLGHGHGPVNHLAVKKGDLSPTGPRPP